MEQKKVLFIDSAHPVLCQELESMAFVCEAFDHYTREDYLKIIPEYTGIIIRSKIKLDQEILEKARSLEFIGRVGAGMEGIDVKFAKDRGIACFNSPEGNRDAVGEHALGLLLNLLNNLNRSDRQVRSGQWIREGNRGLEVKNQTIGIIGYGNMGRAFAQRLKGFEANVLGFDRYKFGYTDDFIAECPMEQLFAECDVVSLHVPLNKETRFMVNSDYLSRFQKPIWFLNTARGECVKTDDLVAALKSGKVLGAGLDVLEYEQTSFEALRPEQMPDSFKYLQKADNVILTPHIAGWTVQSKYKLAQMLADKIKNFYNEKSNPYFY